MIKYLGSKRTLIPLLLTAVRNHTQAKSVLDLFSGTSRVGHALKAAGYEVLSNDHNAYAATLARCYVQADAQDIAGAAEKLIREFNRLKGYVGYFTETFCRRSRFFQPKNGERIDAIRDAIAAKGLDEDLEAVALVALMEAADRIDSTTGVQMAYLKEWAPRSYQDLRLRLPAVLPRARHGKGAAYCMDAFDAAPRMRADVVYMDPPYNQHSYLGNYHIWESLVRWDRPEVYGIACKRVDVRERRSVFNSRRLFASSMKRLLGMLDARAIVLSFNSEGYISKEEIERMLGSLWGGNVRVTTIERDYKRYVGAQIGIFNPEGARVGQVSHRRNKEYIFVATHGDDGARYEPMKIAVQGELALW